MDVNDTGSKFAAGGNSPPVLTTLVVNLPILSIAAAVPVAKFATGVVDTGGKICYQCH